MANEKHQNINLAFDDLTYENAIKELEDVIASLERGDQTLDDSLALFEKGKQLSAFCLQVLEQAELRVKILNGEELVDYQPEK